KRDGTPGALRVIPPVMELQTDPRHRSNWIKYSAYDALVTWRVHEALVQKLREVPWDPAEKKRGGGARNRANGKGGNGGGLTMLDLYRRFLVPFGKVLTDMERCGIYVNAKGHLAEVEKRARLDLTAARDQFLGWVLRKQPTAAGINPASSTQIQTLLFGGCKNAKN
ncbi:unnamed protein product, partial [Phaeothamnion confervicola]